MKIQELVNTVLFYWKKVLFNSFLGSFLLFIILVFIYPITYQSTVTILPPEKNTQYSLGGLLQSADFSSLMSLSTNASSQLYIEVLKSRSAALITVKKLSLVNHFGADSEVEAAYKLSKSINTETTKEGIIKLSVPVSTSLFGRFFSDIDSVKLLSANLSNTLVEALDNINREKMTSKAKRARQYIESEIRKTKIGLDSAELALMNYQKENKAVSLPDQIKVSIDAAAKLKSEIITTEINYNLLSENLRENSSIIESIKSRLDELRSQYKKFDTSSSDFFMSFADAPKLGIQLTNLLREVKVKNEVYLMLQQQFYKEKIQENRDVPTIEVLDKAIKPLASSSPRIVVWTILGSIVIFLIVSLQVVITDRKMSFYKQNNSKRNNE